MFHFNRGGRTTYIWTNAGLLLIEPLGKFHPFSFKNKNLKNVIYKAAAILSGPEYVNMSFNPSGAETEISRPNDINSTDALAPYVTRLSAAIVLVVEWICYCLPLNWMSAICGILLSRNVKYKYCLHKTIPTRIKSVEYIWKGPLNVLYQPLSRAITNIIEKLRKHLKWSIVYIVGRKYGLDHWSLTK